MNNYWIRVEGDAVKECLDYNPNKAGDWRQAVEIKPAIDTRTQYYGNFYFDLSKTPAELIYEVKTISIEDRKQALLSRLENKTQNDIFNLLRIPELNSTSIVVSEMMNNRVNIKNQIQNLQTHEDINAFIAQNLDLS